VFALVVPIGNSDSADGELKGKMAVDGMAFDERLWSGTFQRQGY
jgi:hypothetical protein